MRTHIRLMTAALVLVASVAAALAPRLPTVSVKDARPVLEMTEARTASADVKCYWEPDTGSYHCTDDGTPNCYPALQSCYGACWYTGGGTTYCEQPYNPPYCFWWNGEMQCYGTAPMLIPV